MKEFFKFISKKPSTIFSITFIHIISIIGIVSFFIQQWYEVTPLIPTILAWALFVGVPIASWLQALDEYKGYKKRKKGEW